MPRPVFAAITTPLESLAFGEPRSICVYTRYSPLPNQLHNRSRHFAGCRKPTLPLSQDHDAPSFGRAADGDAHSIPSKLLRLSSMNSIGSAHAGPSSYSHASSRLSTPDRMLFIISSFPEADSRPRFAGRSALRHVAPARGVAGLHWTRAILVELRLYVPGSINPGVACRLCSCRCVSEIAVQCSLNRWLESWAGLILNQVLRRRKETAPRNETRAENILKAFVAKGRKLSMTLKSGKFSLTSCALMALIPVSPVRAQFYRQTNLVSNRTDVGAAAVDANLRNPWGVSRSAASPFWVSDQGTNVTTLYSVNPGTGAVTVVPLVVAVPSGPTGQAFNSVSTDFLVTSGGATGASVFLFSGLNGGISGWNPGVPPPTPSNQAITPVFGTAPAAYTGMALATRASGQHVFAANAASGAIDVFNSTFTQVSVPGGFIDPTPLPANAVPFNVANVNGNLLVSYTGPVGMVGIINEFDTDGHFIKRLVTDLALLNPWGMAVAPADFGMFSNSLLVGNFNAGNSANGPGHISAYDPITGAFLGLLRGTDSAPLAIDGIWQLIFGNGVTGDASALYFAAGINNQIDGLFGSLGTCHGPLITGASANPNVLWPPNHKFVRVTIAYSIADDCDPTPVCTLSTTNNETGASDAIAVDAHAIDLVATREGKGDGRVYTVVISCKDKLPLSSSSSVIVTVPHDQGH